MTELTDVRESLYVATLSPGRFVRSEAVEGPLSPGERLTFTSPHDGVAVGGVESWAIGYFMVSKTQWNHVYLAD